MQSKPFNLPKIPCHHAPTPKSTNAFPPANATSTSPNASSPLDSLTNQTLTSASAPIPLRPASTALLALCWNTVYKSTASAAIESDNRKESKHPLLPPDQRPNSPPQLRAATRLAQGTQLKDLIITLFTRINGFARATVERATLAKALGQDPNPKRQISKSLKGLVTIGDDGLLTLQRGFAEAIRKLLPDPPPTFFPIRIFWPASDATSSSASDIPSLLPSALLTAAQQ